MPRLMIDDATQTNPLALLSTAKIAATTDAVTPTKRFLRATGDVALTLEADCVFSVGAFSPTALFYTVETVINASNLDVGSFIMGRDYYVYICDTGLDTEVYRISLNSTFPVGFNEANSRKIGGFHYGRCRRVNAQLAPVNASGVIRGSGWESTTYEGIIPASVWTLRHRPKSAPEGMLYLGDGIWVDIYLSSTDGAGGLRSIIGALPLTGTEGHNWYAFNELLLVTGKRMLTYAEWLKAAFGSPQGLDANNNNAWSQTTNTGRQVTGFVQNAVSSLGCRDCVGNIWEWIDEFMSRFTATPTNTWAWHDVLGAGNGQAHMNHAALLVALHVGGIWNSGVLAGARAVLCAGHPWSVLTGIGVRGASDSL